MPAPTRYDRHDEALTFVALATLAVGVSAAPSDAATRAAAGRPCQFSTITVKGQPATLGCGPATAVVKVGGKTYRFDHGYCETDDVDQTKLILNLGVISTAPNNGGRPSFDMVMTTSFARASILAYAGGRKIVALHAFSARGAPPGRGTFTDGPTSGSWNCHGVIYKVPKG